MQHTLNNGTVFGNSLKRLIRDLAPFKQVDFITDQNEIQRLQKYPRYRQAYEVYRAQGGHPDNLGVIVGYSESQEQFFLISKNFCDKISTLLNKKLTELTPEERGMLFDTSSELLVDI